MFRHLLLSGSPESSRATNKFELWRTKSETTSQADGSEGVTFPSPHVPFITETQFFWNGNMTLLSKQNLLVVVVTVVTFASPSFASEKACASLWVYDDYNCNGSPKRALHFPTWTKPGSPCYTDVSIDFNVALQFCGISKLSCLQSPF